MTLAFDDRGTTLGVEGDEVERNGFAVGEALADADVVEKVLEDSCRLFRWTGWWWRGRQPSPSGNDGTNARDGVVVELPVVLGRCVPVVDVGLVPDFEVPLQHGLLAVALDEVRSHDADQFSPFLVVLRRVVGGLPLMVLLG